MGGSVEAGVAGVADVVEAGAVEAGAAFGAGWTPLPGVVGARLVGAAVVAAGCAADGTAATSATVPSARRPAMPKPRRRIRENRVEAAVGRNRIGPPFKVPLRPARRCGSAPPDQGP